MIQRPGQIQHGSEGTIDFHEQQKSTLASAFAFGLRLTDTDNVGYVFPKYH